MIPEPIGRRTTTKMIMIAGALAGAQEPIPEPIKPRFSVHPQDTKGRGKLQPVFICEKCSCALGYCIDCPNCKTHPVPPGFMWKDTVQWQALICPCITNSQQLCNKPLGHTQDCSFCQEHRKYWSSKQAQDSWTTLPTATKCMILQLDRILFDLDPIMQAPAVTTQFLERMNKLFVDTGYQDYTPQQHAAYWVHSVFPRTLLL